MRPQLLVVSQLKYLKPTMCKISTLIHRGSNTTLHTHPPILQIHRDMTLETFLFTETLFVGDRRAVDASAVGPGVAGAV